jgi:uncharacterized protein YwgA
MKKEEKMVSELTVDRIILLLLESNNGKISGKTLLQKKVYFLAELLNLELGYTAHYYGPYSPEVDEGLTRDKALGFIVEQTLGFGVDDDIGFEVRRYDYALTEDGKEVVRSLRQRFPKSVERITVALGVLMKDGDHNNYVKMSIAAKTHFLLKQKKVPLSDTQRAARELGWNISPTALQEAIEFLVKAELLPVEYVQTAL